MVKILKNKKAFLIFLLLIVIILIIVFKDKSYEITYEIDNLKVQEKFQAKSNKYYFEINGFDKNFVVEIPHKYLHQKKVIKNILVKQDDQTICIIPNSKKLEFYPLCYQNDEYINYHQINNKELLESSYYHSITPNSFDYNQISINYLNDKDYYIWNYKGFYKINNDEQSTIKIFDRDTYNIFLSYQTKNGILIADYNQDYNFKDFYFLDKKKDKVKKITATNDLSFESYFLGEYKNKIYFMDKKNKKEYEINPKKSTINKLNHNNKGKILVDESLEDISINKLSTKEYQFPKNNFYDYQIIDNKLYLVIANSKMLISNLNVKEIVKIEDDTVYYLVDDKLYYFNNYDGEVLVMSYFEWNFNYQNMIYIF